MQHFGDPANSKAPPEERQTVTYVRRKAKKKPLEGSPNGTQLHFDETVLVEKISLKTPELEGNDTDGYEDIGEKVTYRLAKIPASFVVVKCVSKSVSESRHKK